MLRHFTWHCLAMSGPTGPASSVAAGVALDAAQKGQAWQLALLMLKAGLRYRPADAEI